jgi:tetratricopeptide (TPR) repeat protein
MRVSRYLGPALLMVLPLALLGWIGGGEIGRQAARAENALTDHASALLRSARDRFETLVRARVHGLLRERELQNESLVLTARELSDDPGLLDVLVLERDGHMRFPHPPPGLEAAVPLATASGNRELARAEARETVGDVDGAIALLQEFLRPPPNQADARARLSSYHRLRAAFQLGGLLRARGRTKEAESAYRDARLFGQEPSWFPRETPSLRQARERDIAAVVLLSSVAIGELRGDVDDLLNAMTDISEGRFDVLSDDLLRAVTDRIERAFGEAGSPILTDILATERHRRLGRRFAADYQRNMAETMARRLQQPEPDEDGFGYHAYTGTDGTSLIALRAASNDEREIHGGAFVGVRLDVALLVNADMDAFLTPDENGFYLAIFDPDGNPVL